MINCLNTIRNHQLLQPIFYVASTLLMGRYVCRLPFKATIPASCVALIAHQIPQKQISLPQNTLCWSGLGLGSSLIITKWCRGLAKKLPHMIVFWTSAGLISPWIRVSPPAVNNALPSPLAPIDFNCCNGILEAHSKNLLNRTIQGLDWTLSDAERIETIQWSNNIPPIYILMGFKTSLCFLENCIYISGPRIPVTTTLFSSHIQLESATHLAAFKVEMNDKTTLEWKKCEQKILNEVAEHRPQLQNLAQFLVDLLSQDNKEVQMKLEEFTLIRGKVSEWAQLLEGTHQAPYTDPKKEFGYIVLALAKELDQIDISASRKSAQKLQQ